LKSSRARPKIDAPERIPPRTFPIKTFLKSETGLAVALSQLDRDLLQDCLKGNDDAWRGFCDRFLGLIVHVVRHTADAFRMPLENATREDLVSEVFLALLERDFAILRRFRGDSSLASYLVVVSRRIVVRKLSHGKLRTLERSLEEMGRDQWASPSAGAPPMAIDWNAPGILKNLSDEEASAIRMFHLEGKTYREIGSALGLAENSIGPFLSRARQKLKRVL
jgi:RNA polymerase sigma-70 factor (ECF subfamily)